MELVLNRNLSRLTLRLGLFFIYFPAPTDDLNVPFTLDLAVLGYLVRF